MIAPLRLTELVSAVECYDDWREGMVSQREWVSFFVEVIKGWTARSFASSRFDSSIGVSHLQYQADGRSVATSGLRQATTQEPNSALHHSRSFSPVPFSFLRSETAPGEESVMGHSTRGPASRDAESSGVGPEPPHGTTGGVGPEPPHGTTGGDGSGSCMVEEVVAGAVFKLVPQGKGCVRVVLGLG